MIIAQLIKTAARVGTAGAEGFAQRQLQLKSKRSKKKQSEGPGCTPCEAMARREAARRIVGGGR